MSESKPVVTDAELDEIERLAGEATRGPWSRCGAGDNCRCGIVWGGDDSGMIASVPFHEDEVGGPIAAEPKRLANWHFITNARTFLPACAADLRAFREAARDLNEAADCAEDPQDLYDAIKDFCAKVLP